MKFFYSLIFLALTLTLSAQTKPASYKDYFLEGSYQLLEGDEIKAEQNFELAYLLDSTSSNINYMVGVCYLENPLKKTKAEAYLAEAVKHVSINYKTDDASEKDAPPLAHYFYGEALHVNYKFDEALASYEKFRQFVDPKDKEFLKMLEKGISTAKLAKETADRPLNVLVTNLGDSINSPFPEYSAVLSADERMIIYTTKRNTTTGGMKTENGYYFEDIVVSYKDDNGIWGRPTGLSHNVNTFGHEASINLTPDGQTLIVYRNDGNSKNPEGDGNIYYTTFDGKDWSFLKEFGSDVNTPFQESHACLSADGNVLFFSSERPGGFGGKDIYRCIKLPNQKWSKALNMGPIINTEFDEDGGFIHPDGQTFFFASNGPKSIGGYDIMFATLNTEENRFTNVTNIGYPINTTEDDLFYVTSPDGKRGYFSSAKPGGYGDKDIYMISMAEAKETFLALFKGQLIPAEGESLPDNIQIIVTDKQTNEIIGTYRPKLVNGTFSTILPPGKEYNFSYQIETGEEFYNEDVFVSNDVSYQEIKREVSLEPVRLVGKVKVSSKSIVLNTIILKDSRNKKPIPAAIVTLMEKDGATQIFNANEEGKYDGIILQPEKVYTIFVEAESKKSATIEITTVGIKSAKIINQVIYLDGKAEKFTSKELLLDISVKHPKSKKPAPNANISLTDADGVKYETVTDAKGSVKGIELTPKTKYFVVAYKDGFISEVETFSTGAISEGKTYTKELFVAFEDSVPPTSVATKTAVSHTSETIKVLPATDYEFYYKYGRKVINESDETWINFIENIVELTKKRPVVAITIKSSASRVPSRARGGNPALASVRGKNLEILIRTSLEAKGIDKTKIKFVRTSSVGGPKYRGDWKVGRKKYEKYQYVKARAK
ncbi:hypothetical protein [Aurantibacillus circumpalustris]|uniref:hypothetical protein n=1 Tax=Aurantibacillus circumpalustris TaxID=3036359 RepID=UPI00295C077F|nr:hypothetical protein [Aurantibacillus circumpalustris]